jgi:hypothetical protein
MSGHKYFSLISRHILFRSLSILVLLLSVRQSSAAAAPLPTIDCCSESGAEIALRSSGMIKENTDIPMQVSLNSIPPVYGWVKTWGGSSTDSVSRVVADTSGNIYAVGNFMGTVDFDPDPVKTDMYTSTLGTIDAFISKFDADGKFLWAKTWGGGNAPPSGAFDYSGRDVAYGVDVDSSGYVYVVGPYKNTVDFNPDPVLTDIHTSNAGSDNNIYLSKFSPDGTFQWVRTWGPSVFPGRTSFGAEAYNVTITGNYLYVVGDFSGDQTDFNPWGTHDWHQNHLPSTDPVFFDAFLSKFDLDGNFQWAKTWGGEGYDDGPGVGVDGLGNVYIAGMYASQTINFDPAGGSGGTGHPAQDSGAIVDVFLSKFDSNGNFQWVRTWGGKGTEDAMGTIVVDEANNVYVAGRFVSQNCDFNPGGTPDIHSTNGGQDAFVSKFNSAGTFQWARTWGGSGDDNIMGLAVDGSGNLYASGWFFSTFDFNPGSGNDNHTSNGQHDAFLSQFDTSGNFNWAKTWGESGDDQSGVALDKSGNVYTSGGFASTVDFDFGNGIDNHTSNGQGDVFLSKMINPNNFLFLPLIRR